MLRTKQRPLNLLNISDYFCRFNFSTNISVFHFCGLGVPWDLAFLRTPLPFSPNVNHDISSKLGLKSCRTLSCVTALFILSFKFPRQTLPLSTPVRKCFFSQHVKIIAATTLPRNSNGIGPRQRAQPIAHCSSQCMESFSTTQDTKFLSLLSFLQSLLISCITERGQGKQKRCTARQRGRKNSIKIAEVLETLRISRFS